MKKTVTMQVDRETMNKLRTYKKRTGITFVRLIARAVELLGDKISVLGRL